MFHEETSTNNAVLEHLWEPMKCNILKWILFISFPTDNVYFYPLVLDTPIVINILDKSDASHNVWAEQSLYTVFSTRANNRRCVRRYYKTVQNVHNMRRIVSCCIDMTSYNRTVKRQVFSDDHALCRRPSIVFRLSTTRQRRHRWWAWMIELQATKSNFAPIAYPKSSHTPIARLLRVLFRPTTDQI